VIIGLISVLIDSTDWQDIEAFCAAAILRGKKILDGTLEETDQNPAENQGWKDQKLPEAFPQLG
jgi:hypothetical protein